MKIYKSLITTLLIFSFLSSYGQTPETGYKWYIYFGASTAGWYKSEQPLMTNYLRPWHIFFNMGPKKSFFSIRTDVETGQTYQQQFVLLKSYFFSTCISLNSSHYISKYFGLFAYGGPNVWYSTLSFVNSSYMEKDYGYGFDVAAGTYINITNYFRLSTYFLYESSAKGAWFYAGNIRKQNVGVGSFQFLLSLSYNLL